MNIRRLLLVLLPAVACAVVAQSSAQDIHREWPDFRYLEPNKVRELPAVIRADLEKLGCRIPKFTKWDARHNVIQGQFFKPGQVDWAVLCQVRDVAGILLYPGGKVSELPMLHSKPNDPYRMIHTITSFVLQKRAIRDQKDDEPVAAFDHDGIEDGPIGKPGMVAYYRDGEWTEF